MGTSGWRERTGAVCSLDRVLGVGGVGDETVMVMVMGIVGVGGRRQVSR